MAFTLKKKTQAPTPAQEPEGDGPLVEMQSEEVSAPEEYSELAPYIEEVGATLQQMEEAAELMEKAKALTKPYKEALKKLEAKMGELEMDPDSAGEVSSQNHYLEYGKASTERKVQDKEALVHMLGDDLFIELAQIRIGDIDSYLTPPQKAKVLVSSRGKRNLKVVRRS